MRKSEPHSEAGNPAGPRAGKGHDPVSKRAAIAAKARKNPKEQFNNLLHHLTYEQVAECLDEIPQSSAAGVDGMSAKQASENLSWLLPPILKQIHEGRYTPPPVRRVYIPKADGAKRPIGVPAVIDRAIQAAMAKDLWFERKIKPQFRGKAELVRYADDLCLFFGRLEDVDTMRTLLQARLAQFGLTLAEEKTHKTNLGGRTNTENHERRRLTFLGFTIYRARSLSQSARKTVFQTEGKRFSRAKAGMRDLLRRIKHHPVEEQARAINRILRGHFNYYGIAGNARKLHAFWDFTRREWKHTLSKPQSERAAHLGRIEGPLGTAPAGAASYPDQLPPACRLLTAVIRLFLKSRMREIRTYGSVVGPAW